MSRQIDVWDNNPGPPIRSGRQLAQQMERMASITEAVKESAQCSAELYRYAFQVALETLAEAEEIARHRGYLMAEEKAILANQAERYLDRVLDVVEVSGREFLWLLEAAIDPGEKGYSQQMSKRLPSG